MIMIVDKKIRQELFAKCMSGVELTPEEAKKVAFCLIEETRHFVESCNYDDKLIQKEVNRELDGPYGFFTALQQNAKNMVATHPYMKDWLIFTVGTYKFYNETTKPTLKEEADRLLKEAYDKLRD